MDSKQEKSWTITEVVDLVKDLGPRENTARSYKLFKEKLKIVDRRELRREAGSHPVKCGKRN